MPRQALPRTFISQKQYWYFRHHLIGVVKLKGEPFSREFLEHYLELLFRAGLTVPDTRINHLHECWLADQKRVETIYFVSWESGPIKIGIAGDVGGRLRSLQGACPYRLVLLASTPGTVKEERDYHLRFDRHRLLGEWFERCPPIIDEIDRLNETAVRPVA